MSNRPRPAFCRSRPSGAGLSWVWVFLVLAALGAPSLASAQALADPLVPKGRVRFDFVPSVASWDTRYGDTGDEESLGSDLTDPRGVGLFPGITSLEETLRNLSGDGAFEGRLGSTSGRLSKEVTRMDLGLRIGVFDWLTIGANVPYVKGSSTLDFAFLADPDANLGLNPAYAGGGDVAGLLSGLGDAAVAAENRAQTLCAGGGSEACSGATTLSQQANAFWQGLLGAYFASPFFPLESSSVAGQLQAGLSSLDGALLAAGLPGVGGSLAFADAGMDEAAFLALSGDPALGIAGSPLQGSDGIWQLGDVEINANIKLLEGERRDSGAVSPKLSYGLYGGFLVRLGTGLLDSPDIFLDIGSGDGQMDMEGRVDAVLRYGSRIDLRGAFRYGTQQGVSILRRVAPHEALLPQATSTRAVTWTPGNYNLLELSPRAHLGEALTFAVDYRRYHKAEDAYALLGEESTGLPGVDISLLARETEMTLQEIAVGFRYSSVGLWRQGRVGTPVEVGVRMIRPLSGSGGQVPKATRAEFSLSLFRRIWG